MIMCKKYQINFVNKHKIDDELKTLFTAHISENISKVKNKVFAERLKFCTESNQFDDKENKLRVSVVNKENM